MPTEHRYQPTMRRCLELGAAPGFVFGFSMNLALGSGPGFAVVGATVYAIALTFGVRLVGVLGITEKGLRSGLYRVDWSDVIGIESRADGAGWNRRAPALRRRVSHGPHPVDKHSVVLLIKPVRYPRLWVASRELGS